MTRIVLALVASLALLVSGPAAAPAVAKKQPAKTCAGKTGKAKKACVKKQQRKCKRVGKRFDKKKGKCVRRRVRAPKPAGTSSAPIDYTKIAGLTQPTFKETENAKLMVPAQDGTDLYVEVNKPKADGRYPVILEASPYHGTLYDRTGTRILPDPKGADGKPLGLVGYFVPRGYAVVMLDVRGTGKSGGCLDHLGQNDLSDIKTVIEWAASQPWSNGNVGMTGHSYVGGTTNLGGATGAKGLKTIVPSASLASMYDHQFQAGVPYNAQFLGPIEAYETLAIAADLPPGIPDPAGAIGGPTGDDFGNHPETTGCGLPNSAASAGVDQGTGVYNAQFHGTRDHREAVKNANIPIFMQHGTVDQAARIGGSQWFFERGLRPGDKLWIGQWDHGIGSAPTRRGLQWTYALNAWFDKYLAGRDVDTGPPLEVFMNSEPSDKEAMVAQEDILAGTSFPATKPFTLYARDGEGLADLPGEPGSVSFAGDANGYLDDNEAAGGVTFETAPIEREATFFGIPRMTLAASISTAQTHLIATLFAVDDDGRHRRLTQCSMNPQLREGLDHVAPVVPLTVYPLEPPCFAMAYHLKPGQRLRLRVTTSDPDKLPFFATDPNVTVAFGGADGTQIALPEVTDGKLYRDTIDVGDTAGDATSSG